MLDVPVFKFSEAINYLGVSYVWFPSFYGLGKGQRNLGSVDVSGANFDHLIIIFKILHSKTIEMFRYCLKINRFDRKIRV